MSAPMGTVHQLIEQRGKQGALELGGLERREIEAAATYMADEESGVGFLYSGWCQAALPHRKLPDAEGWQIESSLSAGTSLIGPGEGAVPGAGCGKAVERAVWKAMLPSTFCMTWWMCPFSTVTEPNRFSSSSACAPSSVPQPHSLATVQSGT